ncbi:MAG: DNA repair protein RecN [Pyrinomonadaceae bacterium]
MLNLLKIKNIALIDELEIEFGPGLNLLTGETGSGKSIVVDSLGALTGERVTNDLIKDGAEAAQIEGLFSIQRDSSALALLSEAGIDIEGDGDIDLIVRREISLAGKNRIFINNQLVTAGFLKRLGSFLVDIHGQGEQTALFDPATHLELLDEFARAGMLRERTAAAFAAFAEAKARLSELQQGESEKLQLLDILKFQVDEITRAGLKAEEVAELEEEKRRLNNVEKLSSLSGDALDLLYDADGSTVGTLEKAVRKVEELAEYDSRFAGYKEGLSAAQAVLHDLAFAVRDFATHLEFSPERLEQIENRLAEITHVSRKYGGTVETALEHLNEARSKLDAIENLEFHQEEAKKAVTQARGRFVEAADALHNDRTKAAPKFARSVEASLSGVALERARFEVRVDDGRSDDSRFGPAGFDLVEFYFSANVGEAVKPLARVASGGEASRLMLVLKTTAKGEDKGKAIVFDEIDAGIGGRVAEAVGAKLKELSSGRQVLCVTHQAQVASKADRHFLIEKAMTKNKTRISIRTLDGTQRIEEIARMLAGEKITDAARENAREMIAAAA